jgi:hypothetical protein
MTLRPYEFINYFDSILGFGGFWRSFNLFWEYSCNQLQWLTEGNWGRTTTSNRGFNGVNKRREENALTKVAPVAYTLNKVSILIAQSGRFLFGFGFAKCSPTDPSKERGVHAKRTVHSTKSRPSRPYTNFFYRNIRHTILHKVFGSGVIEGRNATRGYELLNTGFGSVLIGSRLHYSKQIPYKQESCDCNSIAKFWVQMLPFRFFHWFPFRLQGQSACRQSSKGCKPRLNAFIKFLSNRQCIINLPTAITTAMPTSTLL